MKRYTIVINFIPLAAIYGGIYRECDDFAVKDGCLYLENSGREDKRIPFEVFPLFMISSFKII